MTRLDPTRWSLRLRLFLFFALIAMGAAAAMGLAGYILLRRAPEVPLSDVVLACGAAAFAIAGLSLWVWTLFDQNLARPLMALTSAARAMAHAGARSGATGDDLAHHARYLGPLGPAMEDLTAALRQARESTREAVQAATLASERQRAQLEAVLTDVHQGVLVCTPDHRLLLYNTRAGEILDGAGTLGLGRSISSVVALPPFVHVLERLTNRYRDGRHKTHPDGLGAPVLCATANGARTLTGRVSLVLDPAGEPGQREAMGYVVAFEDTTAQLEAQAKVEHLLHEAIEDLRRPVSNIRAAAEVLSRKPSLPANTRATLEALIQQETDRLATTLEHIDSAAGDPVSLVWPVSDVLSEALLSTVQSRLSEGPEPVSLSHVGEPAWLHCDSLLVASLLGTLTHGLARLTGVTRFTLTAEPSGRRIYMDLGWTGRGVTVGQVEALLSEPLETGLTGVTGRDVLDRHRSNAWTEALDGDRHRLRVPLAAAADRHDWPPKARTRGHMEARPEFYDFDLMAKPDAGALTSRPLKSLTYVVFDSETTGLEPQRGDELISIAGVRIVNGRLLRGEVFDSYIKPLKPIPPASTRIHGITDEDVAAADRVDSVLPRFAAFAADSVLVAHNAAFDMTFLRLEEKASGVRFDHPVLDTLLLAAHAFGAAEELTLDALCERFTVTLEARDRHTALGDSLATARVFLALISVLEAMGITTLGEALAVSDKMVRIRREQARRYGNATAS